MSIYVFVGGYSYDSLTSTWYYQELHIINQKTRQALIYLMILTEVGLNQVQKARSAYLITLARLKY